MPAVVVKGAIVVITVVAGIAIAVYESPQVREFAEDCRRRIAVALHSLGEEINPDRASSDPRFNRPEDAEGFMRSTAEPGVEGDEASRRRQREELMYWNQMRMEKLEREKQKHTEEAVVEGDKESRPRGVSFDDFLHKDATNEHALVYQTGADVYDNTDGMLLQRRGHGVRGLDRGAIFANPFADENQLDEQHIYDAGLMSPQQSEMSDLYSATDKVRPTRESMQTLAQEPLVDVSEPFSVPFAYQSPTETSQPPTLAPEVREIENYHSSAGADAEAVFASIHAWADNNSHNASFYSPLPTTPQAPRSEASDGEFVTGEITPTDSVSLIGSGEDVANDGVSSVGNYDVMSEDGDGIITPGSWTEVGSVVSENDAVNHHQ